MPTPLAQRLRVAMAGPPKVTQRALAQACNIKPPSVSDWLNGRTKHLEGKNLLAAAKLLGVNANWLATGVGPMRISSQPAVAKGNMPPSSAATPSDTPPRDYAITNVASAPALRVSGEVPVVGEVKGGPDGYFEESQYAVPQGHVVFWTDDTSAFALRVRNDSMHPRYRAGEFVVVAPNVPPAPGNDVVVVCADGRRMLKELNWMRDGEVQLLSINGNYAPETLMLETIVVMQKVVGRVGRDALIKHNEPDEESTQ